MSRIHWSDVDRVRGALLRIVLDLEILRVETRGPVDQAKVAELTAHVVGMMDALSSKLMGQSRHTLPSFAQGAQSPQPQGINGHE